MRSLAVELGYEVIELRLLLGEVLTRWLGGLQLQCQVHALMPAILLRIARFDPFNANPQPQPPHRQLREIEQGIG